VEVHEYPVLIREPHLDVFGHVNNAAYLVIFEEARWDWITRGGFGLKEIRERGVGPVVLEARLRFQREAKGGDRMLIRSRTLSYKGKIGRVEQVMAREDGRAACTAEFTIALFDLNTRKIIKPTPEWLRAIGPI
jgi:thioesterase III